MHTLLDWLIARYPAAKRQTFKRMLLADRIRIDGKPARNLKQPVIDETSIHVTDHAPVNPPATLLTVIFEDADVLVISKPAGLLTSTGPREKRPTVWANVQQYLSSQQNVRPGLIHRLDRDASGLLIFSKNQNAYRTLKTQFFHHTVTRIYHAVVHGRVNPADGRIDTFLNERADGTVFSASTGQRAITDYQTIRSTGKSTLLRLSLLTGRKHQIRVHLAERGHPIVGDCMYNKKSEAGPLLLAAVQLQIDHPTTHERTRFSLPIQTTLTQLLE